MDNHYLFKSKQYTMFEYENEIEARKTFREIQGCKILSEVIYFSDSKLELDVY